MIDEPRLTFETAAELGAWMSGAGESAGGFWLRVPRAGSGVVGVGYAEAVQVALCHGWIDGQRRSGRRARCLPAAVHAAARAQPLVEGQP